MTAHTLSIVVGAFVFYETMQDLNILTNLNRCMLPNKCIEIMIENNKEVFDIEWNTDQYKFLYLF